MIPIYIPVLFTKIPISSKEVNSDKIRQLKNLKNGSAHPKKFFQIFFNSKLSFSFSVTDFSFDLVSLLYFYKGTEKKKIR